MKRIKWNLNKIEEIQNLCFLNFEYFKLIMHLNLLRGFHIYDAYLTIRRRVLKYFKF